MRITELRVALIAAALLTAAGCSDASSDGSEGTTTTSGVVVSTTVTTAPPETIPANVSVVLEESVVTGVIEQATAEFEVEAGFFQPVVALWATWNDGSLNCPEEGEEYTQAEVEGQWVVLTDGTLVYDYRAGADGEFRYCPAGRPPTSSRAER